MVSCALMGMAGTTFPYYLSYIEPSSAFSLSYAVNSIAMPLIGGMMSWMGPLNRRGAARERAAAGAGDGVVGLGTSSSWACCWCSSSRSPRTASWAGWTPGGGEKDD